LFGGDARALRLTAPIKDAPLGEKMWEDLEVPPE
jgi:hypothetical protein